MIILAAGTSTRMGGFKQLLPVGEQPAVIRIICAAGKAGIREIIVVTGYLHDNIESVLSVAAPDVQSVYNDRYEDGMFSSVCAGISALYESASRGGADGKRAVGADGFFVLPADCCAVAYETLETLVRAFGKTRTEAVAHPVYKGQRGHPPLIPARYTDRIIAYKGDGGLKGSLDTLPSIEVETGDPGVLMDMDIPDEYASLLEYLKKRRSL